MVSVCGKGHLRSSPVAVALVGWGQCPQWCRWFLYLPLVISGQRLWLCPVCHPPGDVLCSAIVHNTC